MKTEKLKKISIKNIAIALSFAALGSISTLSAINIANAKSQKPSKEEDLNYFHHSSFFDEDFYAHFAQIEKHMEEQKKQHQKLIVEALKEAKKNPNSSQTSLISGEDEENYFYQLNFKNINSNEILVALEGNNLGFSYSKKQESNQQKSSSNFYYSFFVKNFDESIKPEITRLEDKIIVKLKKEK
jgi:hypothetical protein